MSFLTTKAAPPPPTKPLGIDTARLASNQVGGPIHYHTGTRILGAKQISEIYNIDRTPIRTTVGKEKKTTGTNNFSSFAILFCHGPVDRITRIFYDGETVWEGTVNRGAEDYVDITIESRGVMRFYWGTETQVVDDVVGSTDDLVGSGQNHGAYRGYFYSVARKVLWGANHTNVPNIEVECGRFPEPSWMTPDAEIDQDINPVAAWWDIRVNNVRAGLRIPESEIDTAACDAVAVTLNSEGLGVSPLLTSRMDITEFLARLRESCDVYEYTTAAGKLALGLIRSGESVAVTIDSGDLLEEPDWKPESYDGTVNEMWVVFSDRDRLYEENEAFHRDRANFAIVQRIVSETVQRPWITKMSIATKLAAATGRRLARPENEGKLLVRRKAVLGLREGQLFEVDYPDNAISGYKLRCVGVSFPSSKKPEAEIDFEEDVAYLNDSVYVPAPDPLPEPPTMDPAAPEYQRAIELPCVLTRLGYGQPEGQFVIGVLVGKPDLLHDDIRLFISANDVDFVQTYLPSEPEFARRGHLLADYPATTPNIDTTQTLHVQFDTPEATLTLPATAEEWLLDEWLMFIGDEIFWPLNPTQTGAKQYRLDAHRAQYGTEKATHASGAEVWLVRARRMPAYWSPGWQDRYIKPQPTIIGEGVPLGDLTSMLVEPTRRAVRPPKPVNLKVGGNGVNPSYGTGEGITMSVSDVGQCLAPFWDRVSTPSPAAYSHVARFEIWDAGVKAGGPYDFPLAASYALSNAQIVAALGGETDFELRCWLGRSGWFSTNHASLNVLFL